MDTQVLWMLISGCIFVRTQHHELSESPLTPSTHIFGDPCPGLHQEKCGHQVERGDSAPLLCSGETSPGVLRSALEPSAQEGLGTVGAGPKEGYKNDPRAGAPLL